MSSTMETCSLVRVQTVYNGESNNNKYLIRHYPRTADTADVHTKLHTNTNCRSQKPVANNQSNIKTDNQSKEEHAV